ncbi:MAG: sulfatase-like hydrolase/transferase [Chitinivibrionales bacterium]|nr:sulfatase-like hydrolase/transferase [Chitinivibrionales bacterium]
MTNVPDKRNVIWVFGDQHRAQMLGCNGDPNVHTPNIDRISSEGVNCENAVAGFPLCCPFRGSLLTSRYPHDCVPGHQYRMPPQLPTIAHAFKDHGFDTSYFGKWHLDGHKEGVEGRATLHIVPPERRGGFDTWIGFENNNAQWDTWVHGTGAEEPYRLPGYETDCLTDLLIDHIRKQTPSAPFFAALSVQPPHDPYIAPEEYMRRHTPGGVHLRPNVPAVDWVEKRARRDLAGAHAMVENLDWNVGRIIRALEETGLADSTYIVFFSDHGDLHGSHGQFHKTAPWAEALSIPFIVGGSGSLNTRYHSRRGRPPAVINHVDIAPTSLGLAGIDAPEWMQGYDYSGLVRTDRECAAMPDSAYVQCTVPTGHGDSVDRAWRGVVTADNWKYICLEHQPWLLFNLHEDPHEQVNLAHNTKYRAERRRLHQRLAQWVADTSDTFALPDV